MTLKLRILQSLSRTAGYPMLTRTIVDEARMGMPDRDKPTHGDVEAALRELEVEGAILGSNNLDLGTRWSITDTGTHRLRNAGL